jgi:hypothetical protein
MKKILVMGIAFLTGIVFAGTTFADDGVLFKRNVSRTSSL